MLITLISILVLFTIITYLLLYIKYKFWILQPVFHFYDVYYWIYNVGIIRHELPEKNKYCNFKDIETIVFNEDVLTNNGMITNKIKDMIFLINHHYLRNKENVFLPKQNNIIPYFTGHSSKTYWSFYWEPNIAGILVNGCISTAESNFQIIP